MTGASAITASVTPQKTSNLAVAMRPRLIRSGLTVPLCARFGQRGRRAVTLSANPVRAGLGRAAADQPDGRRDEQY